MFNLPNYKKIGDLIPYFNNPRNNENAVEKVAESIKQFGFQSPIIIDKANVVIAGHTRLKAAESLGLDEVPVIVANLTDDQARAYRLVDNKTAEFSDWDFEKLAEELNGIDLDLSAFDFDVKADQECYESKKAEFEERMAAGELSEEDEEYQEFVKKFEAKKTTDDCYTPPIIYEAIADYVAEHYGVKKIDFVRPFVPNGDYQKEKYNKTDIVVDNPPFSILSEILKFYNENDVKFFLFAPNLTIFSSASAEAAACICCGVNITYENGAVVPTSFLTNLESCAFRSDPKLYNAVKTANEENLKATRKELPKYSYPSNVVLSTMLTNYSRYGVDFCVQRDECFFLRALDSQKETKKGLFGSGFLISDRKKAERQKADLAVIERQKSDGGLNSWELSERELKIIESLK